MLTADERSTLLDFARRCVAAAAAGNPPPDFAPTDALRNRGAAFVTLRKNGELRGCIGHTHATGELWKSVGDMAKSAATTDPRFSPVAPEEIDGLHIEISVLSPMKRISSIDELMVGRDGLYIKKSGKVGLLLPQVPVNQGWDEKRFLEQTCYKADLPLTAWRDEDAEIYTFTAEVFE